MGQDVFYNINDMNIIGGIVHMKIGLASDHGGYNLKSEIIKYLKEKGIECVDFGPDNSLESVDFLYLVRKLQMQLYLRK